jgi:hypothetical protein
MGQKTSRTQDTQQYVGPQELEYYVIRLEPVQSILLYGFTKAKTTLTWRDVQLHAGINLHTCAHCGVEIGKLFRMQPSIREWVKLGKAQLHDFYLMGPWKPNPFTDLGCNIGDLVLHRSTLTPQLLYQSDISFKELVEKYGLTDDLMVLLWYSIEEWVSLLRIDPAFIEKLPPTQYQRIFGHHMLSQKELVERATRSAL